MGLRAFSALMSLLLLSSFSGTLTTSIAIQVENKNFILRTSESIDEEVLDAMLRVLDVTRTYAFTNLGFEERDIVVIDIFNYGGRASVFVENSSFLRVDVDITLLRSEWTMGFLLYTYGRHIFSGTPMDPLLEDALATTFFVEAAIGLYRTYGISLWPVESNLSYQGTTYLATARERATPGSLKAAVLLLHACYIQAGPTSFYDAFVELSKKWSGNIHYALLCDYLTELSTLSNANFLGTLEKLGFASVNTIGDYVHNIEIRNMSVNIRLTDDFVVETQVTMKISNKGIASLRKIEIYGAWPYLQGTYINNLPTRFLFEPYTEGASAGHLIIYPDEIKSNQTAEMRLEYTLGKMGLGAVYGPITLDVGRLIFANCSELKVNLELEPMTKINRVSPEPYSLSDKEASWNFKDLRPNPPIGITFYYEVVNLVDPYLLASTPIIIVAAYVIYRKIKGRQKTKKSSEN